MTPSGTLTGIFASDKDIKASNDGFDVSGSLRYSFMRSAMFSLTSFSVFACVATSRIGHDARNHLFSLVIRIGRGTRTEPAAKIGDFD